MAHTFAQKVHNAISTAGAVAGAAHTVYRVGKLAWGVGRAVAPFVAMAL